MRQESQQVAISRNSLLGYYIHSSTMDGARVEIGPNWKVNPNSWPISLLVSFESCQRSLNTISKSKLAISYPNQH